MIIISEEFKSSVKYIRYKVYSKHELSDGEECFNSNESFDTDLFYITNVPVSNIKHINGKFFYTKEDLSTTADWFPAHVLHINNVFKKCKKVSNKLGKSISSKNCLIDVSDMPAFNGVNEDASINHYKLYITLFNDFSVKQCLYDRAKLFDAEFNSSKYDLPAKVQNSNFLKSKDFTMINYKRQDDESVKVGLIIKDMSSDDRTIEYGTIYINMENKISIIWN